MNRRTVATGPKSHCHIEISNMHHTHHEYRFFLVYPTTGWEQMIINSAKIFRRTVVYITPPATWTVFELRTIPCESFPSIRLSRRPPRKLCPWSPAFLTPIYFGVQYSLALLPTLCELASLQHVCVNLQHYMLAYSAYFVYRATFT